MKKMTICGALALGIAASTGSAQSVQELLGMNIPAAQAPPTPADTGHASAEEAPFFVAWSIDPVIAGATSTEQNNSGPTATALGRGKISYNLGLGTTISVGWRIPDTYFVLQVSAGFTWNGVKDFQADNPIPNTNFTGELFGGSGNLYQMPIIFSPGFEFELPGGWPFMSGGLVKFGPSIGGIYQDLTVSNIKRRTQSGVEQNVSYEFGGSAEWLLAYGAFLNLEFFLDHNISLVLGYQFIGTSGANYGTLTASGTGVSNNPPTGDEIKTNFTYTNIVKCGLSFYF